MLTINNINKLIGTKIDTTTAEWEIVACESRKNDYRIFINFKYGKVPFMKHQKTVQFTILRYPQYNTLSNEWVMLNNWKSTGITLTKGLLNLKIFVGILGGQLENN